MTSRNTTEPGAGAGNPTVMIATLMVGSFVAILNQTLMISALPTLMREFAVPSSTVQWLTTGFMLANGIMIPVTAFLVETFTTRQLFLYAMACSSPGLSYARSPRASPCCLRAVLFRRAARVC